MPVIHRAPDGAHPGQLTTAYAVLAFWRGVDLLLTFRRIYGATFRVRWLLFADRDVELYEDLYAELCIAHDQRMDGKRVGCVSPRPGPFDRCGDILLQDVLALFDESAIGLLRGPALEWIF